MTPTSYDDIFTCFLENCKIQSKNLPSTDEGKYAMIHNACRHYTNKMEEEALKCDDILETIDKELDDTLEWFCFEKEFGERKDLVMRNADNTIIPSDTIEDIWNYYKYGCKKYLLFTVFII